MTTTAFNTSYFDVRGLFTLSIPQITAIGNIPTTKTPIKTSVFVDAIVDEIAVLTNISIKLSPSISVTGNALEYDIGRGDLMVLISALVPSPIVRMRHGVPNVRTVEFGEFTFTNAKRNNPDVINIEADDRFARFGVNEPQIYTRTISIIAESNDSGEYAELKALIGLRRTLSVYGYQFDDAYISGISDRQIKPGLGRWVWNIEFTYHKFQSVDDVNIDGLTLPTVIGVSEETLTPVLDDRYSQSGINEPIAYTVTRTIQFIDFHGETAAQLKSRIGKSVDILINEETYQNCKITQITRNSPKGGGLISIFDVNIQQYQYNTTDTASFGTITLSHPIIPNAHDISPEYSVDMSAGISLSNPIPVINRRYAFECLTESQTEFNNIVSAIGTKQTLTLNGTEIPLCYISSLSALQPRGGGMIWKYTIEFSKKEGELPITATFNGISLPNCTSAGDEELEIITSRTVLHSGKTSVKLGSYTSKRFTFQCMSNSKTAYDQLVALIGNKYTLAVDGETITKAYISSWSNARKIGTGTSRLYTWIIGFEQETA